MTGWGSRIPTGSCEVRGSSDLHRIYSTPSRIDGYWNQFDQLEKFLGFEIGRPDFDLAVVTTNYDLNIECALLKAGVAAKLPFKHRLPDSPIGATADLHANGRIPLFKLHGSLNWFIDGKEKDGVLVESRVVRVGMLSDTTGELPHSCASDYLLPSDPAIVPPSFLKPDLPVFMRDSWSGAAKALAKADIVIFVGYSFPPSDIEMSYFLATTLSENPSIRRLLVVDPRAELILQRLQDPKAGYGSHFRELLEPRKGDWTGFSLRLLDAIGIG